MNAVLKPIPTVADEELIRFVIYTGDADNGEPEFDDFEVDRTTAAHILRRYHLQGAYIEKRVPRPKPRSYAWECFGCFYIEPREAKA